MKTKLQNDLVWIAALPLVYGLIIFRTSTNAWFGLADDHLHFEANINSGGNFFKNFDFYWQLQPWGHSPRFNPSQLIAWTFESTIFGINPNGWRMTQLLAVLISGAAIGIAVRNLCALLNYDSKKTVLFTIISQALFLALPFWSETIGRIGAPETFAAVAVSFMLVNTSRILANPDSVINFIFLAINSAVLVGFKENLLIIGLCSLFMQIVFLRTKKNHNFVIHTVLLLLQASIILLLIFGFLPELISSGQEVNGAGIGLSRLIIGKWLIVPSLSLGILLFSYLFSNEKFKLQVLAFNFCLTTLVVFEYFIMAGRLGGHYGFLSGVLLLAQSIVTVITLKKFKKATFALMSVLTLSGMILNLVNTNEYFQRTIQFKYELSQLEKIQISKGLSDVVIIASSEEHYEAVSSVVSFNFKPGLHYFLVVTKNFPAGPLKDKLFRFSNQGNKEWHISPLYERESDADCVAIGFSTRIESNQCKEELRISWLGA